VHCLTPNAPASLIVPKSRAAGDWPTGIDQEALHGGQIHRQQGFSINRPRSILSPVNYRHIR